MRIVEKLKKRKSSTTAVIAVGFLIMILIGSVLLTLPIATKARTVTPFVDALFTSVSATCVTGLTVLDTATHWSLFGQTVIMVLIQIGGLGFMTMAVLMSLIVKRKVTPKERMLVAMSYNLNSYENTTVLIKRIVLGTFAIELSGAAVLFTQYIKYCSFGQALYKSIFTAVSAFCNAGFDPVGDLPGAVPGASLSFFEGNTVVTVTLILLILLGGIGFVVWNDIITSIKRKGKAIRLCAYTKFVLVISAVLLFGGALMFALFEWNNPETIGNMTVFGKLRFSLFHSMSLRTAGFYTVDNAGLTEPSKLVSMVFMFIGGASGSTAGGVKIATVGILFTVVFTVFLGKEETVVFGRKIGKDSFIRAVSVIVVQLTVIGIAIGIITASSGASLSATSYEVVSAVSTVGLSFGLTPSLDTLSKFAVMVLMYFGRVGILTVSYAVMFRMNRIHAHVSHPDANMLIG